MPFLEYISLFYSDLFIFDSKELSDYSILCDSRFTFSTGEEKTANDKLRQRHFILMETLSKGSMYSVLSLYDRLYSGTLKK